MIRINLFIFMDDTKHFMHTKSCGKVSCLDPIHTHKITLVNVVKSGPRLLVNLFSPLFPHYCNLTLLLKKNIIEFQQDIIFQTFFRYMYDHYLKNSKGKSELNTWNYTMIEYFIIILMLELYLFWLHHTSSYWKVHCIHSPVFL